MSKSFELVYLQPDQVRFERRGDTPSLTVDGEQHYPRVALRPCFPVSMDQRYLSVRDADGEGQPGPGVIEDWTALAEADGPAVAEELYLRAYPRLTSWDRQAPAWHEICELPLSSSVRAALRPRPAFHRA